MSTVFLKELQPKVSSNVLKNKQILIKGISQYIDKNNEVIYDIGPVERLFMNDEDRSCVFKSIEISPEEIHNVLKVHHLIKPSWKIINNPFNLACALVIRSLSLAKKDDELMLVLIFLTLSLYTSKHKRHFMYIPNRNIMTYTINNLTKKFKLKKFGSLFEALKDTATTSHETYKDELNKGTDESFIYYINALDTRIGHFVKKISNEFYKNHKEGNYLNTETDTFEKDKYHLADNVSLAISKIADNATLNMLTRAPEDKFITLSANMSEVSVNALRSAVLTIKDKKDKEVRELFMLILQLYFENGDHSVESVRSQDFINYCYEIYVKSNTIDKTVIRIKEILDIWLTDCSPQYVKTNRVATKSNFRRALYFYFVFMLQQSYSI